MSIKISGHIKHLNPSQLKALEKLYRRSIEATELVSRAFASEVCKVALDIGRLVGVLLDREGNVIEVIVGSREILYLPDLGRHRIAQGRFRRLRLIFSDLSKNSKNAQIPTDIITDLEKLRLDSVCAVKISGNSIKLTWAHLLPYTNNSERPVQIEELSDLGDLDIDFNNFINELESEHQAAWQGIEVIENGALLVGVYPLKEAEALASIRELSELARTAGVKVLGEYIQRRKQDPRTLLGKGKLEEIVLESLRLGAEIIIFDTELLPSQWRIITNSTDLKILDRSMVILDIFAQRATSSDGRLQVELAQLKYNLPRLVEKDAGLSRLTGGIGGRGPGETKLEIGRRRIRDKIAALEKKIEKLGDQRSLRRSRQNQKGMPLVSIIGYTNAGKSTLYNQLTQNRVLAEDKLFATLDTNQSVYRINRGEPEDMEYAYLEFILSDTVGFIKDLPSELTAAFKATLEEVYEASLLIHLIDASDPQVMQKHASVEKILKELKMQDVPRLTVLNKVDQISIELQRELSEELTALCISAEEKKGFSALREAILTKLDAQHQNAI